MVQSIPGAVTLAERVRQGAPYRAEGRSTAGQGAVYPRQAEGTGAELAG